MKKNNYNQIHIISSLSTGGAEHMLFKILKELKPKDLLVICLGSRGYFSEKIESLNIRVIHLDLKKSFLIKLFKYFFFLKLRSKVIVGWMYHGNLFASYIHFLNFFSFKKSNLIWNIRQTLYDISYEKKITRFIIKLSKFFSLIPNKIIYNSKTSMMQHDQFGFSNKKAVYIPNGFDIEISHNNKLIFREKFNIPKNNILISHINRFHPMKNHELMIDITKKLISKYDNINFVFCGKGIHLENLSFLNKLNFNKKELSRCLFLGNRSDVNEILEETNLFLLTSSWGEGFPNIIGEAMLNECNIISTDVGDVRRILNSSINIVQINNKNEFVLNIEALINSGKIFKKNIIARKVIEENFNIKKIVKQFEEILK